MSKIKITKEDGNELLIKGRVSFTAEKTETGELLIEGKLTTHYYIEDISKIETYRYILNGIDVYREDFGTNDLDILYVFTCKDYEVKGGLTNLPQEIINELEEEEYKNDLSNRWEGDE